MKSTLLAILSSCLLTACNNASLSNQEALEVIRKQMHYPKLTEFQIEFNGSDPSLMNAFATLKKNGVVEEVSISQFMMKVGDQREKGLLTENFIHHTWTIRCNLFSAEPVSVEEILIDKQSQTARVRYIEQQRAIEPTFTLLYNRNNTRDPNAPKPERSVHEVSLKKWDKGWRVIE